MTYIVEHQALKVSTFPCQDHVDLPELSVRTGMKLEMASPWEQLRICPVSVTRVSRRAGTFTFLICRNKSTRHSPHSSAACINEFSPEEAASLVGLVLRWRVYWWIGSREIYIVLWGICSRVWVTVFCFDSVLHCRTELFTCFSWRAFYGSALKYQCFCLKRFKLLFYKVNNEEKYFFIRPQIYVQLYLCLYKLQI